ncbi:hypothetical protein [Acrocarpospora sp. B8E8]|uniref:hypothetical protein n=1 Tax=Acrocarpospora sp. B8E8 TaxID=3153572 RepID=UPI00325DEE30
MSTTSGGPTELDLLRKKYGGRWRITYERGRWHAARRGQILPVVLDGDFADELEGRLSRWESGHQSGDVP